MSEPGSSRILAHWVHRILLAGVVAAGGLMAFGLAAAIVREQSRPVGQRHSVLTLPGRLAVGDGVALIELGLLVLILTPALRVAVLAVGWLAAGDRRFAAVAASVLGLLALSVWLGLG